MTEEIAQGTSGEAPASILATETQTGSTATGEQTGTPDSTAAGEQLETVVEGAEGEEEVLDPEEEAALAELTKDGLTFSQILKQRREAQQKITQLGQERANFEKMFERRGKDPATADVMAVTGESPFATQAEEEAFVEEHGNGALIKAYIEHQKTLLQQDAQNAADFSAANSVAIELAKTEVTRTMGELPKEAAEILDAVKGESMMKLLYDNMMHKGNFRNAGPDGMLNFHVDMEQYARRIAMGDAAQKIVQNANIKAMRAARSSYARKGKMAGSSAPAGGAANSTIATPAASASKSSSWLDRLSGAS